jgi:hypothetical protein
MGLVGKFGTHGGGGYYQIAKLVPRKATRADLGCGDMNRFKHTAACGFDMLDARSSPHCHPQIALCINAHSVSASERWRDFRNGFAIGKAVKIGGKREFFKFLFS